MAVNKFFHDSNKTSIAAERNLYKDLVKEAIQIHGHDVYYVNRTFVNEDTLFGEDNSSAFSTYISISCDSEKVDDVSSPNKVSSLTNVLFT